MLFTELMHPAFAFLKRKDYYFHPGSSLQAKSSHQGCIAPGFFIPADRIQKRYPQVIVSYFAILKIYDTITNQIKTTFLILRAGVLESFSKKPITKRITTRLPTISSNSGNSEKNARNPLDHDGREGICYSKLMYSSNESHTFLGFCLIPVWYTLPSTACQKTIPSI